MVQSTGIIVAFIISKLISAAILNFILIKKFPRPRLKVDVNLCVKWTKRGFYFVMQKQFREGLLSTDVFILSLIGGLYITGLYQAPYKIAVNADLIPLLFVTIFYPHYTDISKTSFKKLKIFYMRYKLYITTASVLPCLFLFIFSKQIIVLLYGNEFSKSVLILRILVISQLFLSLNANNMALLNAIKKEKICFYLSFFIFLLNLILDIILIKFYGVIGVAVSTVICYALLFVATEFYVKNNLNYLIPQYD